VLCTLSLNFLLFCYPNRSLHFKCFFLNIGVLRHRDSIVQPVLTTLTLGITSVFSTSQQVIMGFAYDYTYQDHEYIFRIMNTKHARCYVQCSLWFPAATRLHSAVPSQFCDQDTQATLLTVVANKSALNTTWKPCNIRQLFSRSICACLRYYINFQNSNLHSK